MLSAPSRFGEDRARTTWIPIVVSLASLAACEPTADPGSDSASTEAVSSSRGTCRTSREALIRAAGKQRGQAISRGLTWFDKDVPYSQSRQLDGYRTDCSGFISMCWQLQRSYTTADFVSGGGESQLLRSYDALLPGDALVRRKGSEGHIVLFLGWDDDDQSTACVLEQRSAASDMQFTTRSRASLTSSDFKPIRARRFKDVGVPRAGSDSTEVEPPPPNQEAPSPSPPGSDEQPVTGGSTPENPSSEAPPTAPSQPADPTTPNSPSSGGSKGSLGDTGPYVPPNDTTPSQGANGASPGGPGVGAGQVVTGDTGDDDTSSPPASSSDGPSRKSSNADPSAADAPAGTSGGCSVGGAPSRAPVGGGAFALTMLTRLVRRKSERERRAREADSSR